MNSKNTASVVICEDLSEIVSPIYINSEQAALDAAASLVNSPFTPNDIRNALYPALSGAPTTPFAVTNKLMVAQIFRELLSSPHTPPKILWKLSAQLEMMLALTWNNPTTLKIAACIQALDDCEETSPTLFRGGVNLTFDEEHVINEALRSGNTAKAEAMLAAVRNGKAAGV